MCLKLLLLFLIEILQELEFPTTYNKLYTTLYIQILLFK